MNRPLSLTLLTLGLLVGTACRNAPEERQAGDTQEARTTSAAEPPTGSAGTARDESSAGASAQKPSAEQCAGDEDCTLSRFIPGECCQDCEERPLLRSEYEAKRKSCSEALARCPMRNCAPNPRMRRVACVAGTCQLAGKELRN